MVVQLLQLNMYLQSLKFQIKISIGNGSFTYSAGGNETVLEDIHPQHFRLFYKYIIDYILNNF